MDPVLEGFLWLVMMVGFVGLAGVVAVGGAIMGFIGQHKFKIMFLTLASWVGYKLVKNSEKGNNILDVKPIKDATEKVKDATNKYLK